MTLSVLMLWRVCVGGGDIKIVIDKKIIIFICLLVYLFYFCSGILALI